MNCCRCGKKVTRPLTWDGEIYGKECWKIVALPELEKQRELKYKEWNEKKSIAVEVARVKDLSKITNDFKLKVIKDIINFYDENGFITKRQYDLLTDMFNKKDRAMMFEMRYDAGIMEEAEFYNMMTYVTTGKTQQEFINKLDQYYESLAQ